ncbi:MAG: tRNA (5-methylaminomethyl-2-thiouridine)(34)-methyltransferase MnmD [Pseudomonadota bacterium]
MPDQPNDLLWSDRGVPISSRYDDPYYSLEDGAAETTHVFLKGNGLPARFAPGFHIAELGFGTGLNVAVALSAWRHAKVSGPLRFTSFERFPLAPTAIAKALAQFPDLSGEAHDVTRSLTGHVVPDLQLTVVEGDARDTLADWTGSADAWFLDGFSPAKNPQLWEPSLMQQVARHTVPGGTFATYTAAGAVRRALETAGFEVRRVPGFARKRHMSTGRKPC